MFSPKYRISLSEGWMSPDKVLRWLTFRHRLASKSTISPSLTLKFTLRHCGLNHSMWTDKFLTNIYSPPKYALITAGFCLIWWVPSAEVFHIPTRKCVGRFSLVLDYLTIKSNSAWILAINSVNWRLFPAGSSLLPAHLRIRFSVLSLKRERFLVRCCHCAVFTFSSLSESKLKIFSNSTAFFAHFASVRYFRTE